MKILEKIYFFIKGTFRPSWKYEKIGYWIEKGFEEGLNNEDIK